MMNTLAALNASGMTQTDQQEISRLRKASGELVGSVFFGKLLETMRDNPLKGKYGHGGRGEEVFAAQFHGLIAERLGNASGNSLGNLIVKSLERQQQLIAKQRNGVTNILQNQQ